MSFLQQNWPWLLFGGVMIYMHFFMHRGHGSHGHHAHRPNSDPNTPPSAGQSPETPRDDRHRHGGC